MKPLAQTNSSPCATVGLRERYIALYEKATSVAREKCWNPELGEDD